MKKLNSLPASIFLSGVEGQKYWDIVVKEGGIRNVLTSYYYFKSKPKDTLKKRIEEDGDLNVFIDSGAHTFFKDVEGYAQKPDSFWEEYLEGYTNWIRDNKDYIFACANLDIDYIVGIDKVDEWNRRYFEPLEKEGVNVCYIWHTDRGDRGWEEMCRKYAYVGLSAENDNVQRLYKKLTVARKYGTVVHGMAMTKVEILVKVPFFTVDSTTWIVGQQYGELNWFNGRSMERLSKKEWRTTYKTRLLKPPFNVDWDKIINGMGGKGDTYELLRLNVIAYIQAEEYIRKRLGNKMYWLNKERPSLVDPNWESIKIPERDWFDGDKEDYRTYADGMGVSKSMPKEEVIELLWAFHVYIHEDEEALEEADEEELIDAVKVTLGKKAEDKEEAITLMRQYYEDNLKGIRSDFRDTEVVSETPRDLERDTYIEEDSVEVVEVSKEELSRFLPPPPEDDMTEVSAYDEELKTQGIVAVRDDKGRFIKGNKLASKPKALYSDKYPQIACSTCYKSGSCPEYKEGYVCAYKRMFKRFDTRNMSDIVQAMQGTINFNLERMQRAMIFETMDGGMPTAEVTGLVDQNMRLLAMMKDIISRTPQAILEQRKTINADGTQTIDTRMNVNPTSSGILSRIFGSSSEEDKKEDVIDITEEGT